MAKFALLPSEDEISEIDPEDGPWEVEVHHRLFMYSPFAGDEPGTGTGHATAKRGDVITLHSVDELRTGLKYGAFVDTSATTTEVQGLGIGDFGARPDLVIFVNEHSTDEILAEANGDADMAQLLIHAESEAKGAQARAGVIAGLQAIIDDYLSPETPADAAADANPSITADPNDVSFVEANNVDDTIAAAGSDPDRARDLLAAEEAASGDRHPRKGVVEGLQAIIAAAE